MARFLLSSFSPFSFLPRWLALLPYSHGHESIHLLPYTSGDLLLPIPLSPLSSFSLSTLPPLHLRQGIFLLPLCQVCTCLGIMKIPGFVFSNQWLGCVHLTNHILE